MALFPLSSTTWTFDSLPLDEAIAKMAEIGFEGVDIPVFRQMPVDETGSAERRRICRVVERAGLVLTGFHWAVPPPMSYCTPDSTARLATVAYFKRVIDMAEEMGARFITLGGGYTHNIDPAWDVDACKRYARDSWEHWAGYLEGKEVQAGLEVLSRGNTNFLNTADECVRFLAGLTGPHLGLTLDTYHMNIEEDDLVAPIRRHAGILKVVQVAENHREVPGTGHIPWRKILAALREVEYGGFLSFEIPPDTWGQRPPREPEAELRAGLEFLRREMESL